MPTRTQVIRALSAAISVLTAAKVDEVVKKYPGLEKEIRELNSDIKPKYLEWAAKRLESESVEDLKKVLKEFDRQLHRLAEKDIGKYGSLKEIQEALSGVSNPKSKREIQKGATLYEDERWVLSHPTRLEEACALGKGTKWCIAADGNAYFDDFYSRDRNVQFYLLTDKKAESGSPWSKVAFLFKDGKPFSAEPYQNSINGRPAQIDVINNLGEEAFNKFNEMAEANAKKNPNTWQWSLYSDTVISKEEKRKLATKMGMVDRLPVRLKLGLFPEKVDLNTELVGANLIDADLQGAQLQGAQLTRANLYSAQLQQADLRGADLQRANLRDARLQGAQLRGSQLQESILRIAQLQNADLEGADLRLASLQGADLEGANLKDAYLEGAHLEKANLRGANLEGADLAWAYYDADTEWPEGFTPPELSVKVD